MDKVPFLSQWFINVGPLTDFLTDLFQLSQNPQVVGNQHIWVIQEGRSQAPSLQSTLQAHYRAHSE